LLAPGKRREEKFLNKHLNVFVGGSDLDHHGRYCRVRDCLKYQLSQIIA